MGIDTGGLRALKRDLGQAAGGRVGAKVAAAVRKVAHGIEGDGKVNAAVDTGALRGSISTSFTGDGRTGAMSAEIGPTVDYGRYVEEGTSRMGPQPYMGPAADKWFPIFDAAMVKIVEDAL